MDSAVGYIRVSTEGQVINGASLDRQRERITEYCQTQGLNLIEIFADNGVSGGKPLAKSPAGRNLTDLLSSGDVNHVVCCKTDRTFRNVLDYF